MQNNAVIACRKAGDIINNKEALDKKKKGRKPERIFEVSFSDGNTAMLSEDEVLEFGLYSIGELSKPIAEILERILYERIRDGLLNYILFTLRTEKQVRDKADSLRKDFGEEDVWEIFYLQSLDKLIAYLTSQGYINDSLYAQSYVKAATDRNISSSVIEYELRGKGIDGDIIAQYMAEYADRDYESAYAVLEKKLRGKSPKGVRLNDKERLSVCRYMSGKGFSPDTVLKALRRYEDGED